MAERVPRRYRCRFCPSTFSRPYAERRHVVNTHMDTPPVHDCNVCGLIFQDRDQFRAHFETHAAESQFITKNNIFHGAAVTKVKIHPHGEVDLRDLMQRDHDQIILTIQNELNIGQSLKVNVVIQARMIQIDGIDNQVARELIFPFRAFNFQTFQYDNDLDSKVHNATDQLSTRIEDFVQEGSGWILEELVSTSLEFALCQSLNGRCGFSIVKNPKDVKKARMQIKRMDSDSSKCFYYAIAHHFTQSTCYEELNAYIDSHLIRLDTDDHDGVKVRQIDQFMRKNPQISQKVRINVIYQEGEAFYPIYASKNISVRDSVNLLLHKVGNSNGELRHHYSYIEDLNILLRKSYKSDDGSRTYEKAFVCPNCMQKFSSEEVLSNHQTACYHDDPARVVLSEKPIKFEKFGSKVKTPFIGFFDFESNVVSVNPERQCLKCEKSKCEHKTRNETTQTPSGYSYVIIDTRGQIVAKKTYLGEDPVNHMINSLLKNHEKIIKPLYQSFPYPNLTAKEEKSFKEATHCHICEGSLQDEETGEFDRVRDHDHVLGGYLGASHSKCNLNRRDSRKIPMFCHNFSG